MGAAAQRGSLRLSPRDCLKLWTHSRAEGSLEILITLELTELSVTHIRVHWPNYAGSSVIAVNRKVRERQKTISPPPLVNSKQAGRRRREGRKNCSSMNDSNCGSITPGIPHIHNSQLKTGNRNINFAKVSWKHCFVFFVFFYTSLNMTFRVA